MENCISFPHPCGAGVPSVSGRLHQHNPTALIAKRDHVLHWYFVHRRFTTCHRSPRSSPRPAARWVDCVTYRLGGGWSRWSLITCIGPPEQRLTNLAACDNRHVFSHSSRGSTSESRCGQGHICRQARGQGSSLASGRPWSPLAYMYYFNLCL